jgi:thioredoxin-dependent peroxiredoxin
VQRTVAIRQRISPRTAGRIMEVGGLPARSLSDSHAFVMREAARHARGVADEVISPRPRVGERAPDFTLPGPNGAQLALADLLKQGVLVLYFYPKDQTPGCTMEACAFRDSMDEFVAAGAQVVGISRDDLDSHARFAARHKLPFLLLSDVSGEVHARYGVGKKLALIPERVTFVVDRNGIVRHVFTSMVRMRAHVDESLAIVRQLSAPGR